MAQLFSPPFMTVLDGNGSPVSGAKIYFYTTGTTTPASVYTTSALSVAHSSPVEADASGRVAAIYLDPETTYRCKIFDASDVLIRDTDPITDSLLAVISADDGSNYVGFLQSGTNAEARTGQDKMREIALSATDFGADPSLSGITQRAKLNAAIDAANTATRPLIVPDGEYQFSGGSLAIPDSMPLMGDDPLTTTLRRTDAGPVVTNLDTTKPQYWRIKGLQLKNGTYGIDLTVSDVATEFVVEDVLFADQSSAGFRCNQMAIVMSFSRVVFDSTGKGFVCSAANTNLVSFDSTQFKELGDTSIQLLGGCEAVSITACRFEARNAASDSGGTVLSLQAPKAIRITSSYFEDTFKNILTETGSSGTTLFDSCRFSGQENTGSGLQSETFTSDSVVSFFNNQFQQTSNGATNMLLLGRNPGLMTQDSNVYYRDDDGGIVVRTKVISVTASAGAENLFTFTRAATTADNDNHQTLAGTVRLVVHGITTGGGARVNMEVIRPIIISGFSSNTMTIDLGTAQTATSDPSTTGATLTIGTTGAAAGTITLTGTFTLGSFLSAKMTAYLDVTPMRSSVSFSHIAVAPVAA